jgi:hypothetical protein
MTPIEITILALAVVTIAGVFILEGLLARGFRFANLPGPVRFALRITLGIVFALLGVVGSLLPVMQGWLFFLLAVLVLFPQSKFAIKAVDKCEKRMPRLVARLRKWGVGVHRKEEDEETVRPRVL